MPRYRWTKYDKQILKLLYPTAEVDVIREKLSKPWSWHAITIQAHLMGLRRLGRGPSQSRYDTKAYCSSCRKWLNRKGLKGVNCPECGGRLRLPGKLSYRRSGGK